MATLDANDLQLIRLDLPGVKTLVQWASSEGWNPGANDAQIFYNTDPGGYFGYFHNDELIAGGAVVSYDGLFGFMGLFIVHPDHRSTGIGKKLWYQRRDMLLSRLKPGASIGMDGVVAMQPFYAKGGFAMQFRSERHRIMGKKYEEHPAVIPIDPSDLAPILHYDETCFGFPRPQFLIPWLQLPGGFSFQYTDHGAVQGFAVMRKVIHGYKIGPLFADTPEIAEALYCACLSAAPGEEVFLDIPVVNTSAMYMAKKFGAGYVFECGRMYYGNPPQLPTHKIFGVTTFELG
jgi:GNAT superfamily N-acetyltransferase